MGILFFVDLNEESKQYRLRTSKRENESLNQREQVSNQESNFLIEESQPQRWNKSLKKVLNLCQAPSMDST